MTRSDCFLSSFLWILSAALIGLLAVYSGRQGFDHDEFESIHAAWKLLQGERFAVDFVQLHHPLSYHTLVPIVSLVGPTTTTLSVARAFLFIQMIGIVILVGLLAAHLFDRRTGRIAAVLLVTTTFFIKRPSK